MKIRRTMKRKMWNVKLLSNSFSRSIAFKRKYIGFGINNTQDISIPHDMMEEFSCRSDRESFTCPLPPENRLLIARPSFCYFCSFQGVLGWIFMGHFSCCRTPDIDSHHLKVFFFQLETESTCFRCFTNITWDWCLKMLDNIFLCSTFLKTTPCRLNLWQGLCFVLKLSFFYLFFHFVYRDWTAAFPYICKVTFVLQVE